MSYEEFKNDIVRAEAARKAQDFKWTLGIAAVVIALVLWGMCG